MTPAVFSHGDLRLYLLSLLAEEGPQHGYGIIQALTARTGGTYTPSAGTIYPRLAKLEEEGLVTKNVDGRTTVYAITDAGRAELGARVEDLAGIESGLADSARLIADEVRRSVQQAMKSLRADLTAAANEERAAARRGDGSRTTPSGTTTASTNEDPSARSADVRAESREQLRRADAAINAFRADVRTALRTHVARGGLLATSVVDDLEAVLRTAAGTVSTALRPRDPQP